MIIVVALLAFGLVVTLQNSSGGPSGNTNVISVNGIGYTAKDMQKKVVEPINFANYENQQQASFFYKTAQLVSLSGLKDNKEILALITLVVEQEADKLGIFVSREDAENVIKTQIFIDEEGNFYESDYQRFIANDLEKRLRLKESDYIALIQSYLLIQKVAEVKNYGAVPVSIIQKAQDLNSQTIGAQVFQFATKAFEGTVTPTEEQIKEFYEREKNGAQYGKSHFYTKPKVKLTYIPVNLKSIPIADEKTPETEIELLKIDQVRDYKAYRNFLKDDENDGVNEDIEALAKKHQLPIKTTELVDTSGLKKYFDDYTLTGELASRGTVSSYLFSSDVKKMRRLSVSVPGAHKSSYIHYRLDEIQEPKLMNFEESKAIAQKLVTKELERKARDEAAQKLLDQIQSNGSISDLNLDSKQVKVFKEPRLSPSTTTPGLVFASNLFNKAKLLAPKSASDLVTDDNHASFIYVIKRQIEKNETYKEQELLANQSKAKQFGNYGFGEWVLNYLENADVVSPSYSEN